MENNNRDLKSFIKPFYTELFNASSKADKQKLMDTLLADRFHNVNTGRILNKVEYKTHVPDLFKTTPNLKCEIQDIIQEGNKVVVRSIISGTPKGNFLGLDLNGSKSFSVMAIDIHTIAKNQIIEVQHLEEWTTAIKQLKQ
jgi:predicted ester cyclase